jgi:uncharacterized protein YjbJ (UPF0337 family)
VSENVLETIRATVQDLLAPEMRTHGVRLDNIEKRIDDSRSSLEQRIGDLRGSTEHRSDDLKSSLEHRIDDAKDTLRAEMRALDARLGTLDIRFSSLEDLVRSFMQQVSVESSLRERVASLEARMPKQ